MSILYVYVCMNLYYNINSYNSSNFNKFPISGGKNPIVISFKSLFI